MAERLRADENYFEKCPKTGSWSEVMYREGVQMATRYGIIQPNGVKLTLLYDDEQNKVE